MVQILPALKKLLHSNVFCNGQHPSTLGPPEHYPLFSPFCCDSECSRLCSCPQGTNRSPPLIRSFQSRDCSGGMGQQLFLHAEQGGDHHRVAFDAFTERQGQRSVRQLILCILHYVLIVVHRPANPLLDIHYWSLLEQVLFAQSNVQIRDKVWLIPLLNRIPLAPIVVSFVSLSSRHRDGTLEAKACRCLSALWPLAVSKFSSEALLECFGVLSGYLAACDATEYATNASFVTLGSLIVSSHRASLVNTSNRKKVQSLIRVVFVFLIPLLVIIQLSAKLSSTLVAVYHRPTRGS